MRRYAVLIAVMLALPAWAETPLSAEAFEDYVTGRTITYSAQGRVYGQEEYQAGRRVRWALAQGECQTGRWYPMDRFICFTYDHDPTPQCWTFFLEGGRLRALFNDRPGDTELTESAQTGTPLICAGPDVGV